MINLSESRVLIVDDTKSNIDALVQVLQGDYRLSVALSGEAALRADPRDPSALLALGQTAAQSGERLDRGGEALETCLALPEKTAGLDRAEVRYRLAQIRWRQGNPAAARAEAQAALALSPDHVGAKTLLAQVP